MQLIEELQFDTFVSQIFLDNLNQLWVRTANSKVHVFESRWKSTPHFVGMADLLQVRGDRFALSYQGEVSGGSCIDLKCRPILRVDDQRIQALGLTHTQVAVGGANDVVLFDFTRNLTQRFERKTFPNSITFINHDSQLVLTGRQVQLIDIQTGESEIIASRADGDLPYTGACVSPSQDFLCLVGDVIEYCNLRTGETVIIELPCVECVFLGEHELLIRQGGRQGDSIEFIEKEYGPLTIKLRHGAHTLAANQHFQTVAIGFSGLIHLYTY